VVLPFSPVISLRYALSSSSLVSYSAYLDGVSGGASHIKTKEVCRRRHKLQCGIVVWQYNRAAPEEVSLDSCRPFEQILKMCALLDYLFDLGFLEIPTLFQVFQLRDHVLHEVPAA